VALRPTQAGGVAAAEVRYARAACLDELVDVLGDEDVAGLEPVLERLLAASAATRTCSGRWAWSLDNCTMGVVLGLLEPLAYGTSDFVAGTGGRRSDAIPSPESPSPLGYWPLFISRHDQHLTIKPFANRLCYSCLSEIARSGLTMDATYRGQTMAPWVRKLTTSPSAMSNECSWLEYRPFCIRRVWCPGSSGVSTV
jgi:hypothetical protein